MYCEKQYEKNMSCFRYSFLYMKSFFLSLIRPKIAYMLNCLTGLDMGRFYLAWEAPGKHDSLNGQGTLIQISHTTQATTWPLNEKLIDNLDF